MQLCRTNLINNLHLGIGSSGQLEVTLNLQKCFYFYDENIGKYAHIENNFSFVHKAQKTRHIFFKNSKISTQVSEALASVSAQ
jgi:hypothetical protein